MNKLNKVASFMGFGTFEGMLMYFSFLSLVFFIGLIIYYSIKSNKYGK